MSEQGGLVFDTGDDLRFVPSSVALAVVRNARIVPVPGLVPPALGLALADDRLVTVLGVGSVPSGELVLCDIDGVVVAVSVVQVLATGRFASTADEQGVVWQDRVAGHLDVRALYFEAEQAIWSARAMGQDARHE